MLLSIKKLTKRDSIGREVKFDLFVLRCDTCSREFEKRGAACRITKRTSHYCSKACVCEACKDDGKLAEIRGKTNVERYGASNVFASETVKETIRQTMLERHGVERALQSDEFLKKMQATMVERHGAECASHVPQIRQKQLDTMIERHGVAYPMQMESVKQTLRDGCIKKYGVPYVLQNEEAREKVLSHLIESRRNADGRVQSKPEMKLKTALVEVFGESVLHQKRLGRWWVDFEVKANGKTVLVEVDGEYWHGKDETIIAKLAPDSDHKKAIEAKKERDRKLSEHCEKHNLVLLRFPSRIVSSDVEACIRQIIQHFN